ncbi:MAG: restriction endonuclease subunit S [Nitrospira defluvii]|nr:restriction endonuclease subunit S [Nitrospira defluvii]
MELKPGYLCPPGYKQTEAGVLPEDWGVVSAFDACSKIQDGTHFSPRSGGNDYLYVTSKNVRFGHLDLSTAGWIDATQHQAIYRRCDVKKGDLLLTKDGANTGNAALNTLAEEFSLLSSVAFLRFNPSKHCAAYFLQQVLTSQGQRQIQEAMAGNAITRLTLEKINKLRFPVPPTKAEQEAIAEALSHADALTESLEQLIAKKRHLKQGAMQALLTGHQRLPGFHGEWEICQIRDVADVKTGPFGSSLHERDYVEDGTPIITVEHLDEFGVSHFNLPKVSESDRQRLKAYALQEHDIVFSRVGSVDRNALIRSEELGWLFSGRLLRVRLDRRTVFAPYLSYYFHAEPFKQRVRTVTVGQTMASLNTQILKGITIHLPHLAEQTAIAAILSDMDAEIAALETKLAKARQLKQGMMQELLTGRIRLV